MQFGRVHGRIAETQGCGDHQIRLVVVLETIQETRTVLDECRPVIFEGVISSDPSWLADQFTQEVIGTALAREGWEAFGKIEEEPGRGGLDRATVTYLVRNL
jgi:hypothetical protein